MNEPKPHYLRRTFLTGIFFLIPIGITWWVLNVLVNSVQGLSRPLVEATVHALPISENIVIPDWVITLVSLGLVFLLVLLIGMLANVYLGKRLLSMIDSLLLRLPLIRIIYGGTKQIIEAFQLQRSGAFKKVVQIEYPKKDSWVLGFVTNEHLEDSQKMFETQQVAVFVPSTPNPTTGFLLYLDPHDILVIDLEVEEAVKLIVSAGMVVPPSVKKSPITLAEKLGLPPRRTEIEQPEPFHDHLEPPR